MSPLLTIVVVVVVLITVIYLWGLSPEPVRGRRPAPNILRRRSKWRKVLPLIPLVLAVGCLVLAFTGFRFNVSETSPTIMLVMDVSLSMEQTDMVPSRLAAAEDAAFGFLDELPSDFRVGLATFAGEAELPVPPTQDREAVVDALTTLRTSRGTVIGDGLSLALDAIEQERRAGDVPAAVLLLSERRDTGSFVSSEEAAARAKAMGVQVFTVLIGPVSIDPNDDGGNLEALQAIVDASGGELFTAETADELNTVYENLGSELSLDLEVEQSTKPFVIAAIGLTLLAGFMLVLVPR
jgi:Ca-activated chloride channel family protein